MSGSRNETKKDKGTVFRSTCTKAVWGGWERSLHRGARAGERHHPANRPSFPFQQEDQGSTREVDNEDRGLLLRMSCVPQRVQWKLLGIEYGQEEGTEEAG